MITDNDDMLSTEPSSKPAKAKKGKPAGKEAAKAAKKPSKATVTKPAKGKDKAKAAPAKPAKPAKKAKKNEDRDTGENRAAIIAAASKVKKSDPITIAELAEKLDLPHRTVRTHLRKISADKATGVTMKKDGALFVVHGKV